VAVRGEDRIAILDMEWTVRQAGGADAQAIRSYVTTINGPARVWFNATETISYVVSQKVSKIDVFRVNPTRRGTRIFRG